MKTITWSPGSDIKLDNLFEDLRIKQYNDKSHRYYKNYNKEAFNQAIAFTICWDDHQEPEMCSSIASRNCWPGGAYRILNRLWKANNKIVFPRRMSPSFAESAKSQIEWLKNNVDIKLYFISRQTNNWEDWVMKNFNSYGIEFETDKYKYLTCPNEEDYTCWQKIIYNGDHKILSQWKRQLSNK